MANLFAFLPGNLLHFSALSRSGLLRGAGASDSAQGNQSGERPESAELIHKSKQGDSL
jgi:hypothetical protein